MERNAPAFRFLDSLIYWRVSSAANAKCKVPSSTFVKFVCEQPRPVRCHPSSQKQYTHLLPEPPLRLAGDVCSNGGIMKRAMLLVLASFLFAAPSLSPALFGQALGGDRFEGGIFTDYFGLQRTTPNIN